ncbi:hypothetical protein PtB15_17B280 [Puccinia triticina]|nr:hypothetical protein PtB15_17B280 [Puccinia triticina]
MDCLFSDPRLKQHHRQQLPTKRTPSTPVRIKTASAEQQPKRIKLNHTTTTNELPPQPQPPQPAPQPARHHQQNDSHDSKLTKRKNHDNPQASQKNSNPSDNKKTSGIQKDTKTEPNHKKPEPNRKQAGQNDHKAELNSTKAGQTDHKAELNSAKAGQTDHKAELNSAKAGQNDHKAELNSAKAGQTDHKAGENDHNAGRDGHKAGLKDDKAGLKDNKAGLKDNKAGLDDHKPKQSDNKAEDSQSDGKPHEITKTRADGESETRSRATNHQDYQQHPIIPRCVDKTVAPFLASHPLHAEPAARKLTSSAKLVAAHRSMFKPWFTDQDPARWPFVKQEPQLRVIYPTGAHELFPLLVPKNDQDEYRPLDDLLNVITTTLTYYLTPQQSLHFFSEPHPITSHSASASHTQPHDFSFLNRRSQDRSSPETGGTSTLPKIPLSDPSLDLSGKPLLKELQRAVRRKNGPLFLGLVGWYNRVIKHLIDGGMIGRQIAGFVGMPQGVWETILGQTYDRQVGPQLELLQGYETWSSNVYGELKPRFVSEIIRLVGLRPGMVFLDLGSGIGNIVLQVALEVGCVAVGFEIMDGCATLANHQCREVVGRAHSLWGVSLGAPLLFQADFTKDPRVGQWLRQADVVLVNNQVFTPDLNESLSLLFLELKDSAKIVSLKPFISSSFKLNQRNLHSPLAILTRPALRPTPPSTLISTSPGVYKYPSNSVSWTDNPGEFFLSVVDRSQLINFQSSLNSQ